MPCVAACTSCTKYTNTDCSSCATGFNLVGNSCVTDCPIGMFSVS